MVDNLKIGMKVKEKRDNTMWEVYKIDKYRIRLKNEKYGLWGLSHKNFINKFKGL